MTSAARYAIGDLARLAGVSRRTVRYYVQENVIAAPHGVGRGNHYGPEHLEQILRVKALQEAGKTLEEIRRGPADRSTGRSRAARDPVGIDVRRSVWRRLTLAPGVELQIADHVRLPSPGRLQELAQWCHHYLRSNVDDVSEQNGASSVERAECSEPGGVQGAPPIKEEDEADDV